MAERPLDRLLPSAMALVAGTAAFAAGIAGIAADVMIGRPSKASAVGLVVIVPLALFAAIVGFALGHALGLWLRKRGLNPAVAMRPYRVVMAFVLGVATVIGATFGMWPVLRHERLFQPRVMRGADVMVREAGWPQECRREPAPAVCNPPAGTLSAAILSTFGEVSVSCTREGRITMSRPSGATVATTDLSRYTRVGEVRAASVPSADGGEAFAVLANLRPTRYLLMMFNRDGHPIYEELIQGSARGGAAPLVACASEEGGSFIVDLDGSPVTYRLK